MLNNRKNGDNNRQLFETLRESATGRLRQCANVKGTHYEHLKQSINVSAVSVKFSQYVASTVN